MVVLFGVTWLVPNPCFGTALLRAGAEAGIVGGLADWFAVTALFRHPLGLPIPHTAILPDRIDRTCSWRVRRAQFSDRGRAPAAPASGPPRPALRCLAFLPTEIVSRIVEPIIAALPQIIRAVENRDLRDFLNQAVGEQLRKVDLAPILGRLLEILTHSGEADVLFERAIGIAVHWLEANRGVIEKLVAQHSRSWVPA